MATDAAAFLVRTYPLDKKLRVTFTAPRPERGAVLCMTCEWDPAVPSRLSPRQLREYRRARDEFVGELVGTVGMTAAVIET